MKSRNYARCQNPIIITQAHNAWINSEATLAEISDRFQVPPTTLHRQFKKLGLPGKRGVDQVRDRSAEGRQG